MIVGFLKGVLFIDKQILLYGSTGKLYYFTNCTVILHQEQR